MAAEHEEAEAVDDKSTEGFWITFTWVIAFIIVAQALWLMVLAKTGTAIELLVLPLVISISMLLVIAVFQQFKAPKVYPLCYAAPMMNVIILQAILTFGVPSVGGLVALIIFLAAANALLLALTWDDLSNISTSGISELWVSITPVACLILLGSAALATSIHLISVTSTFALSFLIWSAIWLGTAAAVMVMFLVKDRRDTLPPANWALPVLLSILTVVTVTFGPALILMTGFNLLAIFIVVTAGLVEFAVASAELEPLLRDDLGRVAAALAFGMGYMLTLVCVLLAWLVIIPAYLI